VLKNCAAQHKFSSVCYLFSLKIGLDGYSSIPSYTGGVGYHQ
jgi:hypothetical protein